MASALLRNPTAQRAIGSLIAGYLKLVRRTNKIIVDPPRIYEDLVRPDLPVIVAMWHGQHLMVPFGRPDWMPATSLVSRHGDGELNAIALRKLGIETIRGSGAHGRKVRQKGGAGAFIAMLKALKDGLTVVLTADVPKIARVAGPGIVKLAQASGRPIYAVAVVTSRRYSARNWDATTIGLPFGRCAIVVDGPIQVAREAGEAEVEAARRQVEDALDRAHARAFALVGRSDPGAHLIAANRAGAPADAVDTHVAEGA